MTRSEQADLDELHTTPEQLEERRQKLAQAGVTAPAPASGNGRKKRSDAGKPRPVRVSSSGLAVKFTIEYEDAWDLMKWLVQHGYGPDAEAILKSEAKREDDERLERERESRL